MLCSTNATQRLLSLRALRLLDKAGDKMPVREMHIPCLLNQAHILPAHICALQNLRISRPA